MDNTTLNSGSGGNVIRTLEDGSNVHHPVGVTAFATTVGTPDVVSIVTPTAGLPVRLADGSGYISALPVTDNSGSLTVDGTVAATQSGTWNVGTVTTVSAVTGITNTVTVTGAGGTFPVTDSGGSLTVDNAGTFVVQVDGGALAALQLIDNLVLAEDAAHSSGDPGVQILAVRRDSAAAGSGTDGDYSTLNVDGSGRLWCNVNNTVTVGAHDVTNAGTFAVQAAQSGTWNITNVSGTVSLPTGAATAAKQPALGTAGSASSDVLTVQGVASMTPLQVGDNSGSLTVDAPVGTPVFVRLSDGSSAISTLPVSLASVPSHAVTNAGTFAVQVDGTALTRLTDIETNTDSGAVVGNGAAATAQRVTLANDSTGVIATVSTVSTLTGGGVAHDGADSGNPVKVGAKAESSLSGVTLVADGDRTDLYAGVDGVLITRPHCNLEDVVSGNASNTDGSSTQVIAAAGAGVKQYLTSVTLTNTSSSNTYCELKSGTTVMYTLPVPANGGVTHSFPVPLRPNAANEAWNFDMGTAVTTAYCSMVGFKSKV